jgi:oligopeptide transport system ATP-binding protein
MREQRVRDLVNLVGLNDDHLDRYPHEFLAGRNSAWGSPALCGSTPAHSG